MTEEVVHAKASPSMLIVVGVFAMPLLVLSASNALEHKGGWDSTVMIVVLCFVIFAWWRSFSIIIDQHTLIYKTLFSSRKEIKLSDVSRVVRTVEARSKGVRPPNRLEIYGRINGSEIEFDINLKVFRIVDVRKIEARLLPK